MPFLFRDIARMVTRFLPVIPVIEQDCLPLGILQLLFLAVMVVEIIGSLLLPLFTETLIRRSKVLLVLLTDSTAVITGADGLGNDAACEYEWLLNTEVSRARAAIPTSGIF
jgi:hypothetical protein